MFSLYPLFLASRVLNRLQLSPNLCSPHASFIAPKYTGFLFFFPRKHSFFIPQT